MLMCMNRYARSMEVAPKGAVDLYCQYPAGHAVACSWQSIKEADTEQVRLGSITFQGEYLPDLPAEVVEEFVLHVMTMIERGNLDEYLEALLGETHDRKRTRRGVRLFPRGTER